MSKEQHVAKAATRAKNKYNAANYDSLRIVVPKGAKEALERAATAEGKSINGYVNELLAKKMGVENLKVFSVLVTEREHVYDGLTGKRIDDRGLQPLNGIRKSEEVVISQSPQDANWDAIQRHEARPHDESFSPDSAEYEPHELGAIAQKPKDTLPASEGSSSSTGSTFFCP